MDLIQVEGAFGETRSAMSGFADCDVDVFVRAVKAVESGWFTGPDTARVLERLAIRLEAANEVGQQPDRAVAERAFNAIVEHIETDLNLNGGPPVRVVVDEMYAVAQLFGDAQQPPLGVMARTRELSAPGYFTVAGGAIALLSQVATAQQEPDLQQIVLPRSVYSGLLSMSVCAEADPLFYPLRRRDGVFSFVTPAEVPSGVALGALPDGLYELPGGYGCVVPLSVVKPLLEAVWVMPEREKMRGYCYLRVVPPALRDAVSKALGAFPTTRQLVDVCPQVYTWAAQGAVVYPVADGVTRESHYHVATVGRLPHSVPDEVVLGGSRQGVGPAPHLDAVFESFENSLRRGRLATPPRSEYGSPPSSVARSVASSPPAALRAPPALHSRAFSTGSVAAEAMSITRSNTPVFRLAPGTLSSTAPAWTEYPDSRSREWALRLSGGPAVGCTALKHLSASRVGNLPEVATPEDGRTMVLQPTQVTGSNPAVWKPQNCPVPGWSLEELAATSRPEVFMVPPVPGQMCRYEVSSDGTVAINGIQVPGRRTVVWSDGPLVMAGGGGGFRRHTSIWRAWNEGGAVAAGFEYMNLHVSYLLPVIKPAVRQRERILCARLIAGDESRGETLYRATCEARPGEGFARIHVSDSAESEAVTVGVIAPGLVRVNVHGTVVPVSNGCAMWIADMASLSVGWCIGNSRHSRSGEVVFEVRRIRGHGSGRGKVEVQRLLPAPAYDAG